MQHPPPAALPIYVWGVMARDANGPNFKYLTIFDDLSLASAYNFAADSQQLADFQFSARSTLFNGKVSLQLRSILDPYAQVQDTLEDQTYFRKGTQLLWDTSRRPFTNRSTNFNLNFNLRNRERDLPTWDHLPEDERAIRQQYQPMRIPWNLSVGYTMNYNNPASADPNIREDRLSHNMNLSGNITFGGKWNLRASTYMDVTTRELGATSLGISRDLHCWEFSFQYNYAPNSGFRSYFMTIRAKSPTLRDLKVEKRRNAVDNFIAR